MTRGHILVDGQRQPRPEPVALTLRDPEQLLLARPLVFEDLSVEEFVRAGGQIVIDPRELP